MKIPKATILLFILFLILSQDVSAQETTTHKITITNGKFTPSTLEISIGDVVIFEWAEDTFGHNVAQTKNSNSLDTTENGFRSGDPTDGPKTWELPSEFVQTNVTLFYICEPHASSGMRGKIIVGEGSEEEKSPGFIWYSILLSALVLSLMNRKRSQIR